MSIESFPRILVQNMKKKKSELKRISTASNSWLNQRYIITS